MSRTSYKHSIPAPKSKTQRRTPPPPPPPVVEEPVKAVAPPHLPWLGDTAPREVRATFADKFLAMHRRELLERAGMLRRLGYSRLDVLRRLEQYELWEYEPFHSSPLRAEVSKLVDEVFSPATPRATTLVPGR